MLGYILLMLFAVGMMKRRWRLVLLPASVFITYNPIVIESFKLGIGIEFLALFGCSLAILRNPSMKTHKWAKQIIVPYLCFVSVYAACILLNMTMSETEPDFKPWVVGIIIMRDLAPPIMYCWALAADIRCKADAELFLISFVSAGTLAAIHGMLQYAILRSTGSLPFWATFSVNDPEQLVKNISFGRAFGATPFCSVFGRTMALLIITEVLLLVSKWFKRTNIIFLCMLPPALAVAASQSLASILAVPIGIIVILFSRGGVVWLKIMAVILLIAIPVMSLELVQEPLQDKIGHELVPDESNARARMEIWDHYIRLTAAENPITGIANLDNVDNDAVAVFVRGGLVSLVALIIVLCRIGRSIIRLPRFDSISKDIAVGSLAVSAATISAALSGYTLFTPKSGAMMFSLLACFLQLYAIRIAALRKNHLP